MAHVSAKNAVLSRKETEARLVRHYLYTDGAGGAGPVTYIDASREELAEAIGVSRGEAIAALLSACGDEDEVAQVFADGWSAAWPDKGSPGFFRYLVLTCAVVASADENEDSQDFGLNLQRLYRTRRTFGQRGGLPSLWNRLVGWCASKRAAGAPVRALVLPPRGPGEHIGVTNAMSFPSWRDVIRLKRELERSPALSRAASTPADAARALDGRITEASGYRRQMVEAWTEYVAYYYRGASLLQFHRFWTVLCRASNRAKARTLAAKLATAELKVGGAARDSLLICTLRDSGGADAGGSQSSLECALDDLPAGLLPWASERGVLDRLVELLQRGAAPFIEEQYGIWSFSSVDPSDNQRVVLLLASSKIGALSSCPATLKRRLSERWWLAGPFQGGEALRYMRVLGIRLDQSGHDPLRIAGGVRTRLGWLGRSTLLPYLVRRGTGLVSIVDAPEGAPIPAVRDSQGDFVALETKSSLDGTYRIRLEDALGKTSLAYEKALRFSRNAPEHLELGVAGADWLLVTECRGDALQTAPSQGAEFSAVGVDQESPFDDYLEAVYARGKSGWGEADLIELTRALLPGPPPWDVLRSLQETGWLTCTTSTRWKARKWWLQSPLLISLGEQDQALVLLAGSAPAAVRRRFKETSEALGGRIHVQLGTGPFSAPTYVAADVDLELLAGELGWGWTQPAWPSAVKAPACWPDAVADAGRHELAKSWDWARGCFIERPAQQARVSVHWYRRHEADRADVYVVRSGETRFQTSSREIALVEAYRQARLPMFKKCANALVRLPSEGHLPLHLARGLFLRTLAAPGPILSGTRWAYAYAFEPTSLAWVVRCLGANFVEGAADAPERSSASTRIGLARHRGVRERRLVGDGHE